MATTGGSVNINEPRHQMAGYDIGYPVTDFLRKTLFPGAERAYADNIDFDRYRAQDQIASFVAPGVGGMALSRGEFKVETYKPARLAPERDINPEQLKKRAFNERYHSGMSAAQRQMDIMNRDINELDNAITRREELMCAQILSTGVASIRGYSDENKANYIDDNIDFGLVANSGITTLSGTGLWSADTSDKMRDIGSEINEMSEAGYNGATIIFGSDAWNLFSLDATVRALLDNLNYNVGKIEFDRTQMYQGQGVTRAGRLVTGDFEVNMYIYKALYLDVDGVRKPIYPKKRLSIVPGAIGTTAYADVTQIESDKQYHTYAEPRVSKILVNENDDTMKIRTTSRPLPIPFDAKSWKTIITDTEA